MKGRRIQERFPNQNTEHGDGLTTRVGGQWQDFIKVLDSESRPRVERM